MRKTAKFYLIYILAAMMILSSAAYQKAAAYSPPYSTVKVGLYFGDAALPAANLQNVTGCGAGYEFGILNDSRQFVSVGASTTEAKISMLRDRNMSYDADDNCYSPGSDGSVVVGCFHIQLSTSYDTYGKALAAEQGYSGGFVKYSSGSFYACVGEYTSSADAEKAAASLGIADASVTSGSASTVTVVKTGTNQILFEFEYGSSYWLVVNPVSNGGTPCQTWFKGYRYYGAFEYGRVNGGDLTVLNDVNIEDYTKGVIPYEMANNWPLEALKAQAVCARTYAMANKGKHNCFDVCTTEDCQVYHGISLANSTTDEAVNETAGQYITYNGALCETYYASSDGGATENSENVWAGAVPYLHGVVDPYEADIASLAPSYNWTVTYTSDQITTRLQNKGYSCSTIVSMAVSQLTDVGNVYKVTLTDSSGKKFSFTKGESIRSALGVKSIHFTIGGGSGGTNSVYVNGSGGTLSGSLSDAYAVGGDGVPGALGHSDVYAIDGSGSIAAVSGSGSGSAASSSGVFTISGTGNGHNVGMSQWGAYSMAKYHSKTYKDILNFYFTGVSIG